MLEIEGLSDERSTSQTCHEKRDGTLLSTALPLLGGLHPVRAGPLDKGGHLLCDAHVRISYCQDSRTTQKELNGMAIHPWSKDAGLSGLSL